MSLNLKNNNFRPLVSIGVPTFNRPDGLSRALQCLLNQTYANLEIIVSDNCSHMEKVAQIIDEISQKEPRLRYFRQSQNIGGIANFEFVLKQATGKYFVWFADDDLCEPTFIEQLVNSMEQNPELVLCTCDVQDIDEHDSILGANYLSSIRLSVKWDEARKLFFQYPISNIFFSIYGMYQTSVVREARLATTWKGLVTNAEVPFLAQIAMKGRIASIPGLLKLYRRHSDSWYHKECNSRSKLNVLILKFLLRVKLCEIAFKSEASLLVKASLIKEVLYSFASNLNIREIAVAVLPKIVKKQLKKLCK